VAVPPAWAAVSEMAMLEASAVADTALPRGENDASLLTSWRASTEIDPLVLVVLDVLPEI
jgi:hypothetical protein